MENISLIYEIAFGRSSVEGGGGQIGELRLAGKSGDECYNYGGDHTYEGR